MTLYKSFFIVDISSDTCFNWISWVRRVWSALVPKVSNLFNFSKLIFCFDIESKRELLLWNIVFIFSSICSKFELILINFEAYSDFKLFSKIWNFFKMSSLNSIKLIFSGGFFIFLSNILKFIVE